MLFTSDIFFLLQFIVGSMGVELTRCLSGELDLNKKGEGQSIQYSVGNIIMDGETTTISHIHQNVNDQISVWSDIGHVKKALHGHLLRISSSHKALSKTVIDYLVKCFGYVLTQNKGNPEGIRKGCKVIPSHAFGGKGKESHRRVGQHVGQRIGRQLTDSRPTVGRQSADALTTL